MRDVRLLKSRVKRDARDGHPWLFIELDGQIWISNGFYAVAETALREQDRDLSVPSHFYSRFEVRPKAGEESHVRSLERHLGPDGFGNPGFVHALTYTPGTDDLSVITGTTSPRVVFAKRDYVDAVGLEIGDRVTIRGKHTAPDEGPPGYVPTVIVGEHEDRIVSVLLKVPFSEEIFAGVATSIGGGGDGSWVDPDGVTRPLSTEARGS